MLVKCLEPPEEDGGGCKHTESRIAGSLRKRLESSVLNFGPILRFLKTVSLPSSPWACRLTQSPALGPRLQPGPQSPWGSSWPRAPHLPPGLSSTKPAAANKAALRNCARL